MTERAATTTVPSSYGVAYLALNVPNVWSRNYLLVRASLADVSASELAAEADRIMGAVGVGHRKVELTDADAGDRLVGDFRELGWKPECDVIMVAAREADRDVDAGIVEEVTIDELAPCGPKGGGPIRTCSVTPSCSS